MTIWTMRLVTVADAKKVCLEQRGVKAVVVHYPKSPGQVDIDLITRWWTIFIPFYNRRLLKKLRFIFELHAPVGVEYDFYVHHPWKKNV